MNDTTIKQAIEEIKKSQKRNFKQTVDVMINLKGLDLKKPEHQLEFFLQLPKQKGKTYKICALIGQELLDSAKENMDGHILATDFPKYQKDKKLAKKVATDYDFFVAQATIMPKVAGAFGRVLGPKGRMPNPKAGCIVPPNANLEQLYTRLQKTIKISAKKSPVVHTFIGNEDSSVDDLFENFKSLYNSVLHHLPQGENNVKSVFIKSTMGKPVKIE